MGREDVGSASGPASLALTWRGRRAGGLGPGLTSESADAARAVLRNDLPAGPRFYGTHRRCRSDLPGLGKRPGFTGSGGQRVRAIPQPQERDDVTIVETRAITGGVDTHAGRPRRGRAGSDRRAARRAGVPGNAGRICPAAGLAGRVRDGMPGRDRRDRQLRRRPGPSHGRRGCAGGGGGPQRPAGPAPGRASPTRSMPSALPGPPSRAGPAARRRAGMARSRRSGR